MMKYLAAAKILKKHSAQVDNAVFHLHYRVTFVIFIVSGALVTAKEFIGAPIECISKAVPAKVLNTFCFIMSTFSVPKHWSKPLGDGVAYPGVGLAEPEDEIVYHAYYQWVPFVLVLQAIMFYVPRYLWKNMEGGLFVTILAGLDKVTMDENSRHKKHKILSQYMIKHLHMHMNWAIRFFICEALCLVVVVGNIYFTDLFLGGTFLKYGTQVINFPDMDPEKRVDPMTRIFPRVTKCTFRKFGSSGTIETHDTMCVLAVNIINEKIYIFIWFWLVCLTTITAAWLVYRLLVIASSEVRFRLLQLPTTADGWINISREFERLWDFPQCVGAMDGKHICVQCPSSTGSDYFNYKGFFSIVLFAVVDATYNFTYINVGCQGRISDGGVFNQTIFKQSLDNCAMNLPTPTPLPGREKPMPYVFVGDEAFPLLENIMKPYSGHHDRGSNKRVYNYRLSRARRVVENVFGILTARFRVLRKPMLLKPDTVKSVTTTCVYLHNYLRSSTSSRIAYSPPGTFDVFDNDSGTFIPGSWRNSHSESCMQPAQGSTHISTMTAQDIRTEFKEYFVSNVGRVPWQDNYC